MGILCTTDTRYWESEVLDIELDIFELRQKLPKVHQSVPDLVLDKSTYVSVWGDPYTGEPGWYTEDEEV